MFLSAQIRQAGCHKIRTRIVLDCLRTTRSTESLELAADVLLRGFKEAAAEIHFIAGFDEQTSSISWDVFEERHVALLVGLLSDTDDEPWAVEALRHICMHRADLHSLVSERAKATMSPLTRAALFYALGRDYQASVFSALNDFRALGSDERDREPVHLLSQMKLDWRGREEMFLALLRLRNTNVAWRLLESLEIMLLRPSIGILDVSDIGGFAALSCATLGCALPRRARLR
jgi:hypothetical protein